MRAVVVGCVVSLCVALGLCPGCACSAPNVSVDLRTDLVPTGQFVRVETTLRSTSVGDAFALDAGATPLRQTAHNVGSGDDYIAGVRIAELGALARGAYRLQVSLLDAHASVVASRRVDVSVQGDTAITVVVTRNCIGVTCPPSTDPALTECVDDRCVDPRCSASTPQFCGTPTCTHDSDCHASGCGRASCAGGVCLVGPDDTLCNAGLICWAGDLTCITPPPGGDAGPIPMIDGGMPADIDAWSLDPDGDVSTATGADAWILPQVDASGCTPGATCAQLGYECGAVTDACGTMHDCGVCGTGLSCNSQHRCQSACVPSTGATANGGGLCGNLNEAYTARGINVGYYPFRVRSDIAMYSGDYDGRAGATFTPGPALGGVILQTIPAGAYVGLASNGPWYAPPSGDCLPSGMSCGDPGRAACGSTPPPPRRPENHGFVWGYAYSGGSHMQGWIPADWERLVFAGSDPMHPCALGPAGLDFEVSLACGMPTSCHGSQSSCPATNPCSEGADDCGRTECGAMSGGELTPSAWHRTVTNPGGHACSMHVPDPSIRCFANGTDHQDFYLVYPFGAYLYWAQNSTTKAWLHYGDHVQAYFHSRDAQNVLWDFVEVTQSNAPLLTPASDGAGAATMQPCMNGGTCGWIQDVFLAP